MPPKSQYQAYTATNFRNIPQLADWSGEKLQEIEIASQIIPFKSNSYVIDELIDWSNIPNDPIYTLTFPRKELLRANHYRTMAAALSLPAEERRHVAKKIQKHLNPDPSGQSANVPLYHGKRLHGAQHKYRETVLFFPAAGQTCHAYCTFCFRWPQFSGLTQSKFMARESQPIAEYIRSHPLVTDLLITGGDPMVMNADILDGYVTPFIQDDLPNLRTIRIGTKSLTYWPYRYLSDPDSDKLLRVFEKIVKSGRNLAIMAHFNHPVELSTKAVTDAIRRILSTGAQIRTQSPVLRHINDKPRIWNELWRRQVDLNMVPYYMFVERDTGAKHFFALPLRRCWQIFREAYQRVSGLCRTVRGPVMSATPGKVQIIGVTEVAGEKVFVLTFIQGRDSEWVERPFFARYDKTATWLHDLEPAFGEEEFFFEQDLKGLLSSHMSPMG